MQEKALQLPESGEQQDPAANYSAEGGENGAPAAVVGITEENNGAGNAGWQRRTMIGNIPQFIYLWGLDLCWL